VDDDRATDPPSAAHSMTTPVIGGGRVGVRELLRAPDVDVALALLAFIGLLVNRVVSHGIGHGIGHGAPLDVGLSLLASLPLVLRRRFPLGVLAVVVPLLFVCLAVFHPNVAAVGVLMLMAFTVAVEGGRVRSLIVGALMVPVVTVGVLLSARRPTAADVVAYFSLVFGALFAGEALRARQALERTVAEEAVRQREALAQHRFDEERLGWAHELHDIVGHTLVAINVRASAAARRARRGGGPDVTSALDDIASASAQALAELRSTLKTLRTTQDGQPLLQPIQELPDLAELIAGVESAGLGVDLKVAGVPASLPTTTGHAAYRIVQEGLTNVLRHSTARRAVVLVGVDGGSLVVEVADGGQPRSDGSPPGGQGLRGMKERAAALGGTCEAGPIDGGGWRVRARIPLDRRES
jgi:signal transduction histidine kinase